MEMETSGAKSLAAKLRLPVVQSTGHKHQRDPKRFGTAIPSAAKAALLCNLFGTAEAVP
jgi:hypothetical protein